MYNLWWVVLGLGIATVALTISCVIFAVKSRYFDIISWGSIFNGLGAAITGVIFIILLAYAIINPIVAKNEYNEFLETKMLVEQVYQGDYEQYENAGVNVKVIELNQWLAHTKSEKRQWGNWSMYCGLDVENLDYIVLKNQKN